MSVASRQFPAFSKARSPAAPLIYVAQAAARNAEFLAKRDPVSPAKTFPVPPTVMPAFPVLFRRVFSHPK